MPPHRLVIALIVSTLVLCAVGCGEPRPARVLRGPKHASKGPTTRPGAAPEVALPRAFRGGLTRRQVLERLPPLARGPFAFSFVAYEPARVADTYGVIAKWLAGHAMGRAFVRDFERMVRRMGAPLPRSRADLRSWGIDGQQPLFFVSAGYMHGLWGVGLVDASRFRRALVALFTRPGHAPSWRADAGSDRGVQVLGEGRRDRLVCRFERARALCARHASAFALLRSAKEANLWQSLEPTERRAVATDHGLVAVGAPRAQLLVSWQTDRPGIAARGRIGGRNIERPLRRLALPSGQPKLASLAPRAALRGWTRVPLPLLLRGASAQVLGFAPARVLTALDGEVAIVEDDAGPVVVLGAHAGPQADGLLAELVKQLRTDGPLANWLALRATKVQRIKVGALLGYQLTLRSTERLLPFAFELTAVRAPLGLVLGAGPAVQRMAARRGVANAKLATRLAALKAPLGDVLGPFLARIAPLFASLKMPLPAADRRFAALLAAAFAGGDVTLDAAGGWLRGQGRLDLTSRAAKTAQTAKSIKTVKTLKTLKTSQLVPAVLSSLALLISREARSSAGRNDLYGLRWALTRRARAKGAFPPGQSGWIPKLPCCKQPGGRCTRWIPGQRVGPWKDIGFAPSSAYHQWRYRSNRRGTRVTVEARADQDCDGRYGVWRLEGRIDARGQPRFEPHRSEHRAE